MLLQRTTALAVISGAVILFNGSISAQNPTESGGNPTEGRMGLVTIPVTGGAAHCDPSLNQGCNCNERRGSCALCDPTCSNRTPNCPVKFCKAGCMCLPGYVRSAVGACIPASTCTPSTMNMFGSLLKDPRLRSPG
ncbi:zonadhesin-like [Paramacrobiotus metropolitanus]|uniref:zonadhesin-like n=1 Tax=Paramacrobiotus metropolitanus TaxID=2943436 RepID=UPI0024461004|nr:zonadhesin-like [Paramacrobiotus metropolitanus]